MAICPAHQQGSQAAVTRPLRGEDRSKGQGHAWPLALLLLSQLSPLIWPPPVKAADTKEKPRLTSGEAPTGPLSLPEMWLWCPESDVCGFQKVKMAHSFASVSPPKPDKTGGVGGKGALG